MCGLDQRAGTPSLPTPEARAAASRDATWRREHDDQGDAAGAVNGGRLLVVTSDTLPGYHVVEVHGTVFGSAVASRNAVSDLAAGLKNLVGGELKAYSRLMEDTRRQALERLADEAWSYTANAVIALRLQTAEIAAGAAEVMAYGTAVTAVPDPRPAVPTDRT